MKQKQPILAWTIIAIDQARAMSFDVALIIASQAGHTQISRQHLNEHGIFD